VPVLQEYLQIKGLEYAASEALAKIGDAGSKAQVKEKAYEGEDVNYGGRGVEEALTVVRDLEDKSKKDQWPQIAKQIIHINNPAAKESVKRLMNHEARYVRWEAVGKFRALADESDVSAIVEMAGNSDEIIRAEAIHAMKKLKNVEFGDELMALLSDPADNVRPSAAKAIGYKNFVND
jgi:HEAT repeat protein